MVENKIIPNQSELLNHFSLTYIRNISMIMLFVNSCGLSQSKEMAGPCGLRKQFLDAENVIGLSSGSPNLTKIE